MGEPVEVELQVKPDNAGSNNVDKWVTYDRFDVSSPDLELEQSYSNQPVQVGQEAHGQAAAGRDGRKLAFLSNKNKHVLDKGIRRPDLQGYRLTSRHELGRDEKAVPNQGNPLQGQKVLGGGGAGEAQFQIPVANRPIFSVAELGWIMMVGFTDGNKGDLPARLSGENGDGGFLPRYKKNKSGSPSTNDRLFLDVLEPPTTQGGGNQPGVPHALLLLDQFTTLSPARDGVDNDGDGEADEKDERFVPGTINVNTVPRHLATLATPLPERIGSADALFGSIENYRALPNNSRPTGDWRRSLGIASAGELLRVNPSSVNDPWSGASTVGDMYRYAANGSSERRELVDLYPMPEMVADANARRVHAPKSPEERMARYQFLSQTLSTRSDLYVAYIAVRGYSPNKKFTQKNLQVHEQVAVVLDRTEVMKPKGKVKAIIRMNQ